MLMNKNKMLQLYQMSADEAMKTLYTVKSGLTSQEAANRITEFGHNQLKRINKSPAIFKFFAQFKDLMIVLLLISAAIAFYLEDNRTGIVLVAIVLINALIGFSQEYKAERIMESLEKLIVPEAKVYRNGELTTIAAADLVPGDIIFVGEGDSVPADARILEETSLSSNDFALTGESTPTRKFSHEIVEHAELGNRRNMVFMGTTIALGNAICVVTATGMSTELGRIASLSQSQKEGMSPLQREMNTLATRITIGTVILAVVLVAISLGANIGIKEALLFAIGIASAMIPQGLPAEVNTALSQAANTLAREHALVKKLSAVESLGATSIICTDKTGTLTKNEMTVEHLIFPGTTYHVSGTGYEANGRVHNADSAELSHKELEGLNRFFVCGYFAGNSETKGPDDKHLGWYCIGDPTEGALVTLARKAGIDTKHLGDTHPELREFPFDSVRKRMSSIRDYNGEKTVFVKGAPESVLAQCTQLWLGGDKVRKITAADRKIILSENDVYATKAMRNLAFACRSLAHKTDLGKLDIDSTEKDLVYMGMVSMIDPVRDDVAAAMKVARDANIKVSIITGDYAPTARAIAVRACLADKPEDIILVPGDELPTMTDSKIVELVCRGSIIFARVSPEDKLRIVSLVKDQGKVIAVTGDGINDAPALKKADIGVAMGITGTDVAKQSAEIVLLNDSFATLVDAISQGRTIFQNIRKATLTCLSSNFAELIAVLISLAASAIWHIPPAITAIQILAIDLIAELFPIAALGWDEPESSLMHEQPRDPHDHIFNLSAVKDLLFTGALMGGLAYGNFLLFASRHQLAFKDIPTTGKLYAAATTLTYVTICMCQFANLLIRRVKGRTLTRYMFSNRQLWIAFGISFFCILNIVYNPIIHKVFGTSYLSIVDWLFVLLAAVIFFSVRETYKLATKK
jgi:P-type Ca2+ transporter type 2C